MLRSWGGPDLPCDLGVRAQPLCSLSLPQLGDSPSGALPVQDTPCRPGKHRPAWVGPGISSLPYGTVRRRPEGLPKDSQHLPTKSLLGMWALTHLALGHSGVSLKRAHGAGALGPWRGPHSSRQGSLPRCVIEREWGIPWAVGRSRAWPLGARGTALLDTQQPVHRSLWEGRPARRPASCPQATAPGLWLAPGGLVAALEGPRTLPKLKA